MHFAWETMYGSCAIQVHLHIRICVYIYTLNAAAVHSMWKRNINESIIVKGL